MPIDTTIQPCLHCGSRTATHHRDCPRPLDRVLDSDPFRHEQQLRDEAYEAQLNSYAQLRISPPPPNVATWRITGFGEDDERAERVPEPPEPTRDGSLFGLDRSTDQHRLAGQRLGAPATVVDSARILRELYPPEAIPQAVYAAPPSPAFRAGRQTGRNSLADVWTREVEGLYQAQRRALENELLYGSPQGIRRAFDAIPTDPSMRIDSLTPPLSLIHISEPTRPY